MYHLKFFGFGMEALPPLETRAQAEQFLRTSKNKCIHRRSAGFSLVSEHLPLPPSAAWESTSASQALTIILIYIYKKSGGNYNKKRPLIKWNCHSGIRPSCLSAYSQNKHLKTRPRWCHFLTGKAYWVIPKHLDSYIMFKLFHGWMAAVAWKEILMSGINRKKGPGFTKPNKEKRVSS